MLVNEAQLAAALPGYVLGPQVGSGAFGVVLRATDRLGREVAVKVMPRAEGRSSAAAETEARTLHQLRHPHIVEVFDFVPAGDIALIIMELLTRGSLRERLEDADVSPEWACAASLALASALEFAHGQGLVHRDVKPPNVLFTATGRLKLTDFGIAKAFGESATMSGTVLGTPSCMAPEQFLGLPPGRTVDVYALGVLTYELLAGRPPSDAVPGNYEALRQFHLETDPPPMVGVPDRLGRVVLRALEKQPERRQQTAACFAVELAGAATASLGPGWLQRAGLDVILDPEVLAALTTRGPGPVPVPAVEQRYVAWPAGSAGGRAPGNDAAAAARSTQPQAPPPQAPPPQAPAPQVPPPVVAPLVAPRPEAPSSAAAAPAVSEPTVAGLVVAEPVAAEPVAGDPTTPGPPRPELDHPAAGGVGAAPVEPLSVFDTRSRGQRAELVTTARPGRGRRAVASAPPAPAVGAPAGGAPAPAAAGRTLSVVLNPSRDEAYRRASRRGATAVIILTLSVVALAVLLAVLLR